MRVEVELDEPLLCRAQDIKHRVDIAGCTPFDYETGVSVRVARSSESLRKLAQAHPFYRQKISRS